MALAILCMTMFIALSFATIHALRQEDRPITPKAVGRGKWLR
ncbi:MAG: hypothetical protein ACT6U0_09970 [Shinella sp.]